MPSQKISLLTPWKWRDKYDWFRRDLGLVCDALCRRGHQAELIVLHADGMPSDDPRLVGATQEELHDPAWWAARKSDVVISIAGFRPSACPIHHAIKKAGVLLWNKMDTDGALGTHITPLLSLYNQWCSAAIKRKPIPWLSAPLLFLYRRLTDGEGRGIQMIDMCDKFLVESPLAVSRTQRFFRRQRRVDLASQVELFPGPAPGDRIFESHHKKENRIIAVGRWNEFVQKDTPKLFRVLNAFLTLNPEFSADVVGLYNDDVMKLHASLPAHTRNRILIHGRIPNEQLTSYYQKSKILLCASRTESVHIVSVEALCCGCSIVGSDWIASMPYYAGSNSGISACGRSDGAFLDALSAEAAEWRRGARDPVEISRHFRSELSADAVACIVERLLGENLPTQMEPT